MKRFFGNEDPENEKDFIDEDNIEDEDEDDEDDFGSPEGLIFGSFIDEDDLMDLLQADIMDIQLNQNLLKSAIKLAEGSFFWRFYSIDKKLNQIEKIYDRLIKITDRKPEGNEDAIL